MSTLYIVPKSSLQPPEATKISQTKKKKLNPKQIKTNIQFINF